MSKKNFWMVLTVLFLSFSIMGFTQNKGKNKKEYRYFSKDSFFVYGAASTNNMNYFELGYDSANAFAPVLGLGYRVLNMGNRYFLNLSFDFTPAEFDFYGYPEQTVNFYTFLLDFEGRFFKNSFLSLYLGIGVGIVNIQNIMMYQDPWAETWPEYGDSNVTTLAFEFGFKLPLIKSNKLLARCGVRFYGEVSSDGDEWYWDEWSGDWESGSDFDRVNTQFLFGLEFHF